MGGQRGLWQSAFKVASAGLWSISSRRVQFCMSIKALCLLWMTLAVVRPVSVSAQAGRPAVRMQQLAGAQAQECCVCCLNSGLSQCRPGGAEGRKLLHVYIAELSFGPPQCLMHFCSNIHKCADDPHWCWCSQLCLHPASALCLHVCLWTMKTHGHYFLPYCGCLLL